MGEGKKVIRVIIMAAFLAVLAAVLVLCVTAPACDTTQAENPSETPLTAPVEAQEPPDQTDDQDQEPDWIEFTATAYCPCEKCCGIWAKNRPNGIVYTASGAVAQEGVTIATDWNVLPARTVVYIDGLGERTVQDRGGAMNGNMIDVYFNDHQDAVQFGRQTVRLYIVKGE